MATINKGDDIVDREIMKSIEEKREGFIRGQRMDYRCDKCKSVLEVVEFIYGNVTVVKVKACRECMDILEWGSYLEGYNKGYRNGKADV